jgi:hypothetical protein
MRMVNFYQSLILSPIEDWGRRVCVMPLISTNSILQR